MDGIFRRRNLPHWDLLGYPVFITGCLQGSISQAGLKQIDRYRDRYRDQLKRKTRPAVLSIDEWEHRQQKQLFAFIDKLLDNHSPVKHFKEDQLAEIVTNAFLHFAEVRYSLLAFVVMPSHHHWLFVIDEPWATEDQAARVAKGMKYQTPREVISQSVQSFTATECNKTRVQTGRFWQQETYDHWARDEDEMNGIIRYIENNPVVTGLTDKPENYRWSSAHYRNLGILPGGDNGKLRFEFNKQNPRQDA